MTTQKTMTARAAVIALSLAAMAPLTTMAMAQNTDQVYGSQLMTQQERFEYRQRLQNANTAAARERIRAEHHQRIQERAKGQGIKLPEQPPAQGMHQGSGMGVGQGRSQGPGQGGGMGQGGGRGRGG